MRRLISEWSAFIRRYEMSFLVASELDPACRLTEFLRISAAQPISQPPDVTNNTSHQIQRADRVNRYGAAHVSSVRMTTSGMVTGFEDDSGKSFSSWNFFFFLFKNLILLFMLCKSWVAALL